MKKREITQKDKVRANVWPGIAPEYGLCLLKIRNSPIWVWLGADLVYIW